MPREGLFSEKNFLVGKYAENERFRKILGINQFRFLYILWNCQRYTSDHQELCNEPVRCGIWGRQMPQVSGSFATSESLRCHMWQFRVWKMRKMEWKNGFLTPFSFLDWTKKLTRFCKNIYLSFPKSIRQNHLGLLNTGDDCFFIWQTRPTVIFGRNLCARWAVRVC